MKILLILSASPNDPLRKRDPFMPLSLPILAGTAPTHDYKFINMLQDSIEIDYDTPVDVVGISIRFSAESVAFQISDEFRKRNVKVILGGPQPSSMPFRSIEHADAVAVGEGEQLWPVILQDIENQQLKEFYVCSPTRFDPKGRSLYQLDGLPDLKGLVKPIRNRYASKYTFDMVFASRGCPIDCDFCTVTKIFGSKYRLRPVNEVVNEIAGFKSYYYLIDDTVFGRPSTYDYYLELYDKISLLAKKNYWTGQANLDAVSTEKGRDVIRKAAEAGLVYVAVGIESINKTVLEKSRSMAKMGVKNQNDVISSLKENIAFIQDQGIVISGWFAIGYEEDAIETYYQTYEFCKETNILPVVTPVHALPGSRLFARLEKEGKLQDHNTNITNVSHPVLTNDQVMKALKYVVRKGFSLSQIIKRTWFYSGRFTPPNNTLADRVHKTIFAFITQRKMGKIIQMENEKLSGKLKQ